MAAVLPVRPTFPPHPGASKPFNRPRWARHLEPRDEGGVVCPCCGLVFGPAELGLASWHVQHEHPIPADDVLRELGHLNGEEYHVILSLGRAEREAELRAELEAL